MYHACQEILEGDNEKLEEALIDTMIWRDTCLLQARHTLLILATENLDRHP